MAPAPAAALSSLLHDESSSPSSPWTNRTVVCVMDASGTLGSSLVHRLLQRHYSVHAAFHTRAEMLSFERIYGGSADLKLFHTDPLDYHSIMDALNGCSGLFYSFEPPSDQPSYDEFMADMEVRAAHNVLEACAQTHTMDKVVFTSSATAVIWRDRNDSGPPSHVDERNWSNINFCKKFKLWHGLSKTLAERTAWALAMDRGVNMVAINGGLLLSPPDLTITSPYLKGASEMYEDGVFVSVDLRFLVDSHICVFEDVSAYGRYLCFNHVIDCNEEAVKLAQMLLPNESGSGDGEESKEVQQLRLSNTKLNKLMVDFECNQIPN